MKQVLVFSLALFMVLAACQHKEMDIDFTQRECKRLDIDSPLYTLLKDPSCGTDSDSLTVKVVFKHPSQKKCIDEIVLAPEFYSKDQNKINNVQYNASIKKEDPDVLVEENSATFILKAKFATVSDAQSLNNVILKFHTENKLDEKSATTSVRINGTCAKVLPTDYKIQDTVQVTSDIVNITFMDDADEDQDIISVYLNGVWVMENYSLLKKGETFSFKVNKGTNDFVLFAINEGTSGPNTCAIKINGGNPVTVKQDLKTGGAIRVLF